MVDLSFTSQPGFTGNQIIIFPWHAKNLCRITNIQAWKLGRVLKDKCVRNQSEMALGKNKPCCYFCDINLPGSILFSKWLIAPLVVTNWRSLSWKSRPRGQFKNYWTAPWNLQKAKDNIKNKIEGYPRVERWNISRFSFCKQFWNIPTPLVFQETRWENLTAKISSPEQHSAFREL